MGSAARVWAPFSGPGLLVSTQVRMKSMFAIGFCFTALMGMFNSM